MFWIPGYLLLIQSLLLSLVPDAASLALFLADLKWSGTSAVALTMKEVQGRIALVDRDSLDLSSAREWGVLLERARDVENSARSSSVVSLAGFFPLLVGGSPPWGGVAVVVVSWFVLLGGLLWLMSAQAERGISALRRRADRGIAMFAIFWCVAIVTKLVSMPPVAGR